MTWLRTEEEVDRLLDDMKKRTKGAYLTQGVSFNKSCPRQMNLLKKALMSSISFSGLSKELLAIKFNSNVNENSNSIAFGNFDNKKDSEVKSLGNFL